MFKNIPKLMKDIDTNQVLLLEMIKGNKSML